MSAKTLEKLRGLMCAELDEIAGKPEMNAGDLETVHKLTGTIKNIDKVMMAEDDYSGDYSRDGDYSRAGDWNASGTYSRYGRGNSYANRGRHYVRGHYSRGSVMEHLEQMMDEANADEKEMIRRWKEELQRR